MKLTEAKLKQLIIEVLEEGMKTIADLPEGVFITVNGAMGDLIEIYYSDTNGKEYEDFLSSNKSESAGGAGGVIGMETQAPLSDEFPCLNAMSISFSAVEQGWGPLLYDIAIEVATLNAGGLTPDRTIVSTDAYGVWEKYENERPDVEVIQLDNEDDSFKNGNQDDCVQNSARKWSDREGVDWKETPVSKMFKKEPATLIALRDQGKLIIQDVELNF